MAEASKPIIHLNGFPGTGKLTIARHLVDHLNQGDPSSPTRAKLVHNHLLIDPANAVLERTQPGYQALRKKLRDAIFSTLADGDLHATTQHTIYVFTDWQSGDAVGSRVCRDFQTMARARGSLFVPVLVTCGEEENVRRLGQEERRMWGKVTDVELLKEFRRETVPPPVYEFAECPARLVLDVTELEPQEAAMRIVDHVRKVETGVLE